MGTEQRPGNKQAGRFVETRGPIPREREERILELIRLRHAHVYSPFPAYIDHELTPEIIAEDRETVHALSEKELVKQIRKERRRLRKEAYDQRPGGLAKP